MVATIVSALCVVGWMIVLSDATSISSQPINKEDSSPSHQSPQRALVQGSPPQSAEEAFRVIEQVARIMQHNQPIARHTLTGLLDAVLIVPCFYHSKTDQAWAYFKRPGVKPTQVQYSKMMKIYSQKGNAIKLHQAAVLVDQWLHEFKTDPRSLAGSTRNIINVRSPVIINQMLRAISLWTGKKRGRAPIRLVLPDFESVHSALLHYFRIMIELDILPDKHTLEILWAWTDRTDFITPALCVQLVQEAKSTRIIDWILHELLFHFIDRRSFPRFDEEHNRTITSSIWKLAPNGISDRLFLICREKIHYLCHGDKVLTGHV